MYEEAIKLINQLISDAQWASPIDRKQLHILQYIKDNLKDRDGEFLNDNKW